MQHEGIWLWQRSTCFFETLGLASWIASELESGLLGLAEGTCVMNVKIVIVRLNVIIAMMILGS